MQRRAQPLPVLLALASQWCDWTTPGVPQTQQSRERGS